MDGRYERVERAYRDQASKMWRALVGFTGDPEIASDALSEAFARAIREQDGIRDVTAWTWRVAFRLATAEMRRRSAQPPGEGSASYEMTDVLELVDALRSLTPNQRLAVVLHDYADRPTAEVAEVLGSTQATVYVHLSQGRRRLRRSLEERDA